MVVSYNFVNILKTTELYTFKRVYFFVCELYLSFLKESKEA